MNPVTGRIELIDSHRWGGGLGDTGENEETGKSTLNLWSIDPNDLLAGSVKWRFDGTILERALTVHHGLGYVDGLHPGGLFAQLKKRIVERTLDAEMDEHLGYSKHNPKGNNSGNSRNGRGKKKVVIGDDEVVLTPPRDRNGSFEPQMIPKGQRSFKGFDDKIIAMYARGMSVRDIQAHLLEMYDVDVSEGLISQGSKGLAKPTT